MGIKKPPIAGTVLCLAALILGFSLASCRTYSIPDEVRRVPEEAQAPVGNPDEDTEGTSVQVYYLDKVNQRMVPEEYPLPIYLNQETYERLFYFLRAQPPSGKGWLTPSIRIRRSSNPT